MRFWNLYFGILNNKYILHIFIELKKTAEKVNSNVIFHNIHLKKWKDTVHLYGV